MKEARRPYTQGDGGDRRGQCGCNLQGRGSGNRALCRACSSSHRIAPECGAAADRCVQKEIHGSCKSGCWRRAAEAEL